MKPPAARVVRSQHRDDLPEAQWKRRPAASELGIVFGAYRTFQVRVRDLAAMTGYGFGPLAAADPLDRAGEREARGLGAKPVVLVDRFDAVVL